MQHCVHNYLTMYLRNCVEAIAFKIFAVHPFEDCSFTLTSNQIRKQCYCNILHEHVEFMFYKSNNKTWPGYIFMLARLHM